MYQSVNALSIVLDYGWVLKSYKNKTRKDVGPNADMICQLPSIHARCLLVRRQRARPNNG